MFKKIFLFAIIITLFSNIFVFAQIEEGVEKAVSSNLTQVALPSNAQRILPPGVPAEIVQTLEKFVSAGDGKFQQGDSEVLAWTKNYKKSDAPNLIK